jgi:hypothetical protein
MKRLIHDASWAKAEKLFREMLPLISDEDAQKWWALIYKTLTEAVEDGLKAYVHEHKRLNPFDSRET